MSSWANWVLPPLIGAVIGGVTNDIAIRMLFRPYAPWRVLGWRLPLTPGLIPRERGQIAYAIADTFTQHVLDGDQVADLLLTDAVRARLKDKVAGMVDQLGGLLGANAAMLGMAKGMAGDLLLREIAALARDAQRAEALASPCEPGPETLSPAERASLLQPAKENL